MSFRLRPILHHHSIPLSSQPTIEVQCIETGYAPLSLTSRLQSKRGAN
jgi:hypothetical protein